VSTARELRASLDLERLRRVADGLAVRLMLEAGLGGAELAALGAVLAGIGASACRDEIRDAWMMHLADIADREEQHRRALVDDLAAEMRLRDEGHAAMAAELARIMREAGER
jgi:hypothetical protein